MVKKKYNKPEVSEHGDIKRITKGGLPGGKDSEGAFEPPS